MNIHDVKNQKKVIIAEIVIFVFYCLSREIKTFLFCFEKRWLENVMRMSPQHMTWSIIERLESKQIQRSEADTVAEARIIITKLWIRFQETGHVWGRPR